MEQGIGFRVSSPPPPTAPTHPLQPPLVGPVVGSPGHCAVTVSFLCWAPGDGRAAGQPRERSGASHARPQSVTLGNPNQFSPGTLGTPPCSFPPQLPSLLETTIPRSNSFLTQLSKISLILHHSYEQAKQRSPASSKTSLLFTRNRTLIFLSLPSSFSSSSSISHLSKTASPSHLFQEVLLD